MPLLRPLPLLSWMRPWLASGVLAVLLVSSAPAGAAPRRMVISSGADCADAELSSQAKAFADALRSRAETETLGATELSERLFPQAARSFEELRRQLDAARDHFYEGRNAKAGQLVEDALHDIARLPVGEARWRLHADAQLLLALNLRAQGKAKESDAAFLQVLRLQPQYPLDPDLFAPSVRQAFDKVRRELTRTRKVKVSVKSTLPASEVYLDGLRVGQTPLQLELPAGTYDLALVKAGAHSFSRQVQVQGADLPLLVDLAFEGAVSGSPFPCLASSDPSDERTLAHAVRLGGALGVEEVILARLEHPSSGPKWFAATVLHVEGGQRLREGGFKTQGLDSPTEALSALVDFVTTGRSPSNLVVMNASGKAPWEQPTAAPAAPSSALAPDAPVSPATEGLSRAAPSPTASRMRVASYATLGVGAAALGGAGVVRWMAQKDLNALKERQRQNGGVLTTDDAEAVRLREGLVKKNQVLTGLLIGGGVTAAAGAVLFLLSPTPGAPPPVTVGLGADDTGGWATMSGAF
ncbi:PEGA domain-containing protein [Myxococcaceae bacterium JPH2]|nr:PEGA domain-containing protein [Myxococcaceae bacterium JPH2]